MIDFSVLYINCRRRSKWFTFHSETTRFLVRAGGIVLCVRLFVNPLLRCRDRDTRSRVLTLVCRRAHTLLRVSTHERWCSVSSLVVDSDHDRAAQPSTCYRASESTEHVKLSCSVLCWPQLSLEAVSVRKRRWRCRNKSSVLALPFQEVSDMSYRSPPDEWSIGNLFRFRTGDVIKFLSHVELSVADAGIAVVTTVVSGPRPAEDHSGGLYVKALRYEIRRLREGQACLPTNDGVLIPALMNDSDGRTWQKKNESRISAHPLGAGIECCAPPAMQMHYEVHF
ncbi:hypothetical protein EVAR_5584_1 [Eumeta japonica]|uniref:Uncharacterized protein n=1 Tax=Eumeta variegata TaxID=151549 RepID=A0A4C1U266_EUMVA|nr:hypothetical protein EVAR_5584_1 [Eumeta japonica]